MRLNRGLIKSQAKQIIKGNVFGLFLICLVVGILSAGISSVINLPTTDFRNYAIGDYGDFDSGYFDDFTDDNGMPDLDYFKNFNGKINLLANPLFMGYRRIAPLFSSLLSLALAPLEVTLCGMFVLIIRGRKMKTGDCFDYVFKNTFNSTYLRKFGVALVRSILIGLLLCLFIIPGIICYYNYYFAYTIMSENPNLGVKDALKLSKQMSRGHKGELFALDLSFLGWLLLVPITFGLISIYTLPYYNTTKALYYENFRLRAIQEGNQAQFLFMTDAERNNFAENQPSAVEPQPEEQYGSGMDTDYYNGNF